jgi:CelD/BcsL family acetyltransferase involved in cellulose biosynthesis
MKIMNRVESDAYDLAVAELVDEWDELADRAGAAPFARPGWICAWWRAFGKGTFEPVTLRHDGRLTALIGLARAHRRLESPTNWHTPAFAALAEDDATLAELVGRVFIQRPPSVQVGFIDPDDPLAALLRESARRARYSVLERTLVRSPFLEIEGDWEAYERSLSKNVRNDVGRRLRRLSEEGKVTFEVADGSERLDVLLAEGFAIEAAAWKGKGGTAIASDERTSRFYREVASWAASRGWLRLGFLRLDGRPIAFLYDLEENGVHYYLKGGYDPGLARFSPSKVLLHLMVQRAFRVGLRRFEFGGSDEAYKLQWASATRDLALLQAFSRSLQGLAERAAHAHGRPLAKRVLALAGR